MEQICPKKVFPVQSRTNAHHHRIQRIVISLGAKFHFKQTVLISWTKFAQKGYFPSKAEQVIYYYQIQHIRISISTNFHLKLMKITIEFSTFELVLKPTFIFSRQLWFGPNLPNKGFYGFKTGHMMNITISATTFQRIWISLGTKFHLKQTILIFWNRFAEKGYFQSKTEKVNITVEFSIFELV